jgi:hypothetical protein
MERIEISCSVFFPLRCILMHVQLFNHGDTDSFVDAAACHSDSECCWRKIVLSSFPAEFPFLFAEREKGKTG